MSLHLVVCRRASQVEKVVGRAKIELKRRVPVLGQFGFRCLDVYGLKIVLRSGSNPPPLQANLWILSCAHSLVRGRTGDRHREYLK